MNCLITILTLKSNMTVKEYQKLINENLCSFIPECKSGEDIVHRAMEYSLSVGGKRIRPILVLESCRLCGGDILKALPVAVAVEMIHTYSLIHDDLPCIDNDDFRRGKPSCHKAFGEAYALLAGDGLLTASFGVIAGSQLARDNPSAAIKIISLLSDCCGADGMIGGQVLDLINENKSASYATVALLDKLKTGALIRGAVLSGALSADADSYKLSALAGYADSLGAAFQITDDILNVIGDENKLGKPVGTDSELGKSTYVSLLGINGAKKLASEYTEEAVKALELFGDDSGFLKELAYSLAERMN